MRTYVIGTRISSGQELRHEYLNTLGQVDDMQDMHDTCLAVNGNVYEEMYVGSRLVRICEKTLVDGKCVSTDMRLSDGDVSVSCYTGTEPWKPM